MDNSIRTGFLAQQQSELQAFAASSAKLDIYPFSPAGDSLEPAPAAGNAVASRRDMQPSPPSRYVMVFQCRGVVLRGAEVRVEHQEYAVGLNVPDEYLRETYANPAEILTWLGPQDIWHPNIRWPFICTGRINPATPLKELVIRCYEIITYHRYTPVEHDALNPDACAWARRNRQQFPLENEALVTSADPETTAVVPDFVVEAAGRTQ